MTLFAQFVLTGIVTGCFLILATIGFSFTRRVEGFLNIAHAELLGVSAFTTWALNKLLGWNIFPSAFVAIGRDGAAAGAEEDTRGYRLLLVRYAGKQRSQ